MGQDDLVFHTTCGKYHRATTSLDEDGFPVARLLEPCPAAVLDGLASAAGRILAIAVDSGHLELADEALEAALELNDEPGEQP